MDEDPIPNEDGYRGLVMIGFWRNSQHPELPEPAVFVDHEWDQWERARTTRYLEIASLAVQWRGYSWCRMCDLETNGTKDFTDGVYVWPEGLAHYVRDHGVRLPESVVAHFLAETEAREIATEASYARGPLEWLAMTGQ